MCDTCRGEKKYFLFFFVCLYFGFIWSLWKQYCLWVSDWRLGWATCTFSAYFRHLVNNDVLPQGQMFTCTCMQVEEKMYFSAQVKKLTINKNTAIHWRCSMRLHYMLLLTEYKYAYRITHTGEHPEGIRGSNEARGDAAGLSVNPQLADTQRATSMATFLKCGQPVQWHQQWGKVWGEPALD